MLKTTKRCIRPIPAIRPRVAEKKLFSLLTQILCISFISKSWSSWVETIPSPSLSVNFHLSASVGLLGSNESGAGLYFPVTILSIYLCLAPCFSFSESNYEISKSSLLNSSPVKLPGSLFRSAGATFNLTTPAVLELVYLDLCDFPPTDYAIYPPLALLW